MRSAGFRVPAGFGTDAAGGELVVLSLGVGVIVLLVKMIPSASVNRVESGAVCVLSGTVESISLGFGENCCHGVG